MTGSMLPPSLHHLLLHGPKRFGPSNAEPLSIPAATQADLSTAQALASLSVPGRYAAQSSEDWASARHPSDNDRRSQYPASYTDSTNDSYEQSRASTSRSSNASDYRQSSVSTHSPSPPPVRQAIVVPQNFSIPSFPAAASDPRLKFVEGPFSAVALYRSKFSHVGLLSAERIEYVDEVKLEPEPRRVKRACVRCFSAPGRVIDLTRLYRPIVRLCVIAAHSLLCLPVVL